jgi:hypothetical protein
MYKRTSLQIIQLIAATISVTNSTVSSLFKDDGQMEHILFLHKFSPFQTQQITQMF